MQQTATINNTQLGLRILYAESEAEVQAIIENTPEMTMPRNWHPLDDRETNFNVVNNQSSQASKALTELIVNASDAVIMKAAALAGIHPGSPDAPQTPQLAVARFFGDHLPGAKPAGRLNDIPSDEALRSFAINNLIMGVTCRDDRSKTCFTIVDNGEGQKPEDFRKTFLSLSHKNKSDIPYVQGKYNMGSSGVLIYCGQKRFKLIVSRHHSRQYPWGWTLIREKPNNPGAPIYEYYAPEDIIPTMENIHDIKPLWLPAGSPDDQVIRHSGTVVKLYNYKIDGQNDFRGIRNGINRNMVSTTLPVRVMDYRFERERRTGRSRYVDERTALGMEAQLLRRSTADSEDDDRIESGRKLKLSEVNDPGIGTIAVEAVLFDEMPEFLKGTRDRVFHHVNGQVQYKRTAGFLSQTIKLPGITDHVVIIVDASNLKDNAHHKIWSANRENILNTAEGETYKSIVETALKESNELKEWEQQKALEQVNKAASNTSYAFQRLLNRAPEIKHILGLGTELVLPNTPTQKSERPPYKGQFTPTFLTLNPISKREEPLELEIGERRALSFKTDAENEYLDRADSAGKAHVTQLQPNQVRLRLSHNLRDGTFLAYVQTLGDEASPGDSIELEARFRDSLLPQGGLSDTVRIVLVAKRERQKREPKNKPQRDVALPKSVWMTKDGRTVAGEQSEQWPDGFDETDGGQIKSLGEQDSLHLINFDNVTLQNSLKGQSEAKQNKTISMHRTGMQLAMLAIQRQFENHCNALDEESRESLDNYREDFYKLSAQAVALVMPLLVKTLPEYFLTRAEEEE